MKDIVEVLAALNKEPGVISISYRQIDSFHKLILDELPYGQIDPTGIVQGLIEIDGPAQDPPNGKKPLQWHFGGIPYEIGKAIRIQYGYQKYVDGIQINAICSLFIGYELSFAYPPVERARLEGAQADSAEALEAARQAFVNAQDLQAADDSARFADALRSQFAIAPGTVTRVAKYVNTPDDFDGFIRDNLPFTAGTPHSGNGAVAAAASRRRLSEGFVGGHNPGPAGVRIELDGPARDYNSKNAFPYTAQTLFNDPSGLYDKLLWWYFGGRAFRITKAMRVRYDDPLTRALLIGYQGPNFP